MDNLTNLSEFHLICFPPPPFFLPPHTLTGVRKPHDIDKSQIQL